MLIYFKILVNSKDPFEFTFYQKTQLLPAKQTRSLARNWMKPNKSMESNVVGDLLVLKVIFCIFSY